MMFIRFNLIRYVNYVKFDEGPHKNNRYHFCVFAVQDIETGPLINFEVNLTAINVFKALNTAQSKKNPLYPLLYQSNSQVRADLPRLTLSHNLMRIFLLDR